LPKAPNTGFIARSRPIAAYRIEVNRVEVNRIEIMEMVLKYATTLAAVGVFLVLLAGFWNMMRGSNPNLSQKLMRWRVGLQFLAIMIAMILVYWLRP
jgi:sterol desaturase/sphingolipid hydroxylase (fatty acid hydroxylase superfamily)